MNLQKDGCKVDNLLNQIADPLIYFLKEYPDKCKKILSVFSDDEVDSMLKNFEDAGRKDVADKIRRFAGIATPDKGTLDAEELTEAVRLPGEKKPMNKKVTIIVSLGFLFSLFFILCYLLDTELFFGLLSVGVTFGFIFLVVLGTLCIIFKLFP